MGVGTFHKHPLWQEGSWYTQETKRKPTWLQHKASGQEPVGHAKDFVFILKAVGAAEGVCVYVRPNTFTFSSDSCLNPFPDLWLLTHGEPWMTTMGAAALPHCTPITTQMLFRLKDYRLPGVCSSDADQSSERSRAHFPKCQQTAPIKVRERKGKDTEKHRRVEKAEWRLLWRWQGLKWCICKSGLPGTTGSWKRQGRLLSGSL